MELKTAIEILDYHQEWRLGKREDMIHEPKKLTEALDIVLSEVKKLPIHNVVEQSEQLRAFKQFLQSEYHLPISNRMVDEFELKQNS